MKNKLKSVMYGIAFTTILVILLFLTSKLFAPKVNGEVDKLSNSRMNGLIAEKKDSIDVLIMGDSLSFTSFIPLNIWNETGITTYIGGTNSQKLSFTYDQIDKMLELQKVKMIILEGNNFFRKVNVNDGISLSISKIIPIFEYHSRWKNINFSNLFNKEKSDYLDEQRGFRINMSTQPAIIGMYKKHTDNKFLKRNRKLDEISPINREYLDKIKEICDEKGIKLVFLSTPSPLCWSAKKHNAISKLAKEYDIDYLDMNLHWQEIGIDWNNDTYDKGDHLNIYGAKKTTKFLMKYLKDSGLFEDKRSNPKFASWDKAYQKNKKILVD
ncbi:hypothetical protein [Helcococcus kunzii]|uniref:hypothetical protein n=1 Tax=Helcococcus kunzii TaxID=40091 RepID=UPI0038A4C67B